MLLMAGAIAGCDRRYDKYDENAEKEKFCSHVNAENIDKTIPVVNQFLSRLSAGLDGEQQLQELVEWLKSCPCIIEAAIFNENEISFSFDENELTKHFIMAVSMEKPLKVTGLSEYEDTKETLSGTQWKLVGFFDVENNRFREPYLKDCDECYTLDFCTDVAGNGHPKLRGMLINIPFEGYYIADYTLSTIYIEYLRISLQELYDGEEYGARLNDSQTFEFKDDQLKLYYKWHSNAPIDCYGPGSINCNNSHFATNYSLFKRR